MRKQSLNLYIIFFFILTTSVWSQQKTPKDKGTPKMLGVNNQNPQAILDVNYKKENVQKIPLLRLEGIQNTKYFKPSIDTTAKNPRHLVIDQRGFVYAAYTGFMGSSGFRKYTFDKQVYLNEQNKTYKISETTGNGSVIGFKFAAALSNNAADPDPTLVYGEVLASHGGGVNLVNYTVAGETAEIVNATLPDKKIPGIEGRNGIEIELESKKKITFQFMNHSYKNGKLDKCELHVRFSDGSIGVINIYETFRIR